MSQPFPKPIRLLIVDDHQVVRLGLRTLLGRYPDIEVVGEASTVAAAILEAKKLEPDVILMDVRLPDGTGFDACRELRQERPATRVLFLTSFADDKIVLDSILSGANGYLLKEVDESGLVTAIRTVATGQSILDPAVTCAVLARIKSPGVESLEPRLDDLSPQENRVLALVSKGKTNKEIGTEMGLSDKTVKNYLSNLMDKLRLSRRSEAAAFYAQHRKK